MRDDIISNLKLFNEFINLHSYMILNFLIYSLHVEPKFTVEFSNKFLLYLYLILNRVNNRFKMINIDIFYKLYLDFIND